MKELALQEATEIKRKMLDNNSALDERVDGMKESLFVSTKILKNALASDAVHINHLENDRDRSVWLAPMHRPTQAPSHLQNGLKTSSGNSS